MASRQMAFQMGPREFFQRMVRIVTDTDKDESLKGFLDRASEGDAKERAKMLAVFVVMEKLMGQGDRDKIFRFKKMVVWRDEKGEPRHTETEFGHAKHDLVSMGILTPEALKAIKEGP